ncbi:MAG: Rieske 2Fe-2S domain-containing protein, partial [Acidimicrobiales bacterium]
PLAAVRDLPVPAGWYAVAIARELPPGTVRRARIGDDELVVWRAADGGVAVATAWCPHLGAHLGHVGRVEGAILECGFHGFRFDREGRCVATGYGGRPPARARIRVWDAANVDGIVLAWYHPMGEPPTWTVPELTEPGWTPPAWRRMELAGHPLEVTENSVDLGHLSHIHGYRAVETLEAASVDGPVLRASYAMTTVRRLAGVRLPTMRTRFDVEAHGLGFSTVDLHVLTIAARLRLFVLPTPLGGGRTELRLGVTGRHLPEGPVPSWLRWVPSATRATIIRSFTLTQVRGDVAQDERVWRTKRHADKPLLAEGDGPIGLYRRWAQQFFVDTGRP